MFQPDFVCLSVCLLATISQKMTDGIFVKIRPYTERCLWTKKSPLNFVNRPNRIRIQEFLTDILPLWDRAIGAISRSLITRRLFNSNKLKGAAATICPAPLLPLWAPKRLAPPSRPPRLRRQRSNRFPR